MKKTTSILKGLIEKIGEETGRIYFKYNNQEYDKILYIKDHKEGIRLLEELLISSKAINSFDEFIAVGHRVVHGGEYFGKPILIDNEVIKKIEELSSLAPLHNPVNLIGIKAIGEIAPKLKQVAVFDTAFHQSMPEVAYHYALPKELYEEYSVRRYGFHGTSHQYVSKEAAKFLNKDIDSCNLITIHLGNGDSITAIKNGQSVDTSMGLTPLEGLVMGTRCGDIDPAIIFYIAKNLHLNIDEIDTVLNKKSGLKGICGTNDMREIEKRAKDGDSFAKLAIEIFCYRIKKYIGSYMAVLGSVDAIIFTGGIGENSFLVREKACAGLDYFGIIIDQRKNRQNEIFVNQNNSKIKVMVIPTNEELEIAKQSFLTIKE